MNKSLEWEFSKWLHKNGSVKRFEIPEKFSKVDNRSKYYHVNHVDVDSGGFWSLSPNDIFEMDEKNRDAYENEIPVKIRLARDWIQPITSIVAIVLSVIAIIVSIIALRISWIAKSESPQLKQELKPDTHTAQQEQATEADGCFPYS